MDAVAMLEGEVSLRRGGETGKGEARSAIVRRGELNSPEMGRRAEGAIANVISLPAGNGTDPVQHIKPSHD